MRTCMLLLAVALFPCLVRGDEPPPETDPTKVLVILEVPNPKIEKVEEVKDALMGKRRNLTGISTPLKSGNGLGGLQPVMGTDMKTAHKEATAAGAGTIVQISLLERKFTVNSTLGTKYTMAMQYTFHELKKKRGPKDTPDKPQSWQSGTPQRWNYDVRSMGDCEGAADMLGAVLLQRLCPYSATAGKATTAQSMDITLTVTNSSPYAISGLRVGVPLVENVHLFRSVKETLKPGEKKKVTFTFDNLIQGSNTLPWQRAFLTEVVFDKPGAEEAGEKEKPKEKPKK